MDLEPPAAPVVTAAERAGWQLAEQLEPHHLMIIAQWAMAMRAEEREAAATRRLVQED